ncbi:exopolysaccharide biosynthesis protein [Thermosynechococcus sp. B0]|uniref:exopolysaccharide biosynthesis protein n=1 Tax=unclassified Thermosynechococcus TaxID=2622553 RepID=UPI002575C4E8|nr:MULTISPECIES: exopolysaccharide biosynthesis protein [unclassified Thermosynechococcus]WJI25095.1 exopolysaccharide biosynthesis protein [Thermosynechococcus sp. B0]WJI27623.1 exopolysaccharide biosynthesis protein [Thermosynechococcus sp. B1]WJI30155.1 exopolysaccharide biosynthesis protein [Thermosynechococcus sp. B3]
MAKLSTDLERAFLSPVPSPSNGEVLTQQLVSLGDILQLAGERTFGFLLAVLSLPSALPIPAPGYSTPFGIVLLLLGWQLLVGASTPWLPPRLLKRTMPRSQIQKIVRTALPWLRRIELISRPRLRPICTTRGGRLGLGVAVSLMAISMILPIPGTNTIPAMGIFTIGFGLLDDDGLISLAGVAISLIGLAVTTSILVALAWGGNSLLDVLKAWLHP